MSVTKKEIFDFLQTQPLGVISSLDSSGQPQSATVAFSQTADLSIIIGTSKTSRKANNIVADKRTAFVATDIEKRYTVQLEATAKKLTPQEFATYEQAHFKKLPMSAPFKDIKGQCYFLLKPTSLKFTDCSQNPWQATTFSF